MTETPRPPAKEQVWCDTCSSWRFTVPCGRDNCPPWASTKREDCYMCDGRGEYDVEHHEVPTEATVGQSFSIEHRECEQCHGSGRISITAPSLGQVSPQATPRPPVKDLLKLALEALPDSQEGGPDGTGYKYIWDQCTSAEQDYVKGVREILSAADLSAARAEALDEAVDAVRTCGHISEEANRALEYAVRRIERLKR